MMDEVGQSGMGIDVGKLSRHLGVPVIPTVAVKKEGFSELKAAIGKASLGNADPRIQPELDKLVKTGMGRGDALLVLEGDEEVAFCHGK